jgi:hypothetical protein
MVAHDVECNSGRMFQEALERPAELAKEYPITSMLMVFGVGLGVGVLLSQAACGSLGYSYHEPTFTERLSRQVFHTVNEVLPDAVRQQMARFQA